MFPVAGAVSPDSSRCSKGSKDSRSCVSPAVTSCVTASCRTSSTRTSEPCRSSRARSVDHARRSALPHECEWRGGGGVSDPGYPLTSKRRRLPDEGVLEVFVANEQNEHPVDAARWQL